MTKPFFLLTGDDSVRAEGLILVRRIVEKFANVAIVATQKQQSAVSGKLNFGPGKWGKEVVDGFETIWVDGSPGDAVNFAFDYLDRKPDFVISGMNLGENVDNSLITSGTFSAALRASYCRATPAIALSLEVPIEGTSWIHEHTGSFREELLDYPGNMIEPIIKQYMERSKTWFGVWNVNFPKESTDKLKFTPTYSNNYFENRIKVNTDNTFEYIYDKLNIKDIAPDSDVQAMRDGYIAITPIKYALTDREELERLKGISILA